ncbi:universal stress protein [Natronobiforma cellulositropha]|uniref:universal stress protein n=1 Tax=Natronobiforma cellulositropha TaxID=1679076 RepID=UPI0021D57526|nr:universal stress protein [Natronobiforma cellulositropha]
MYDRILVPTDGREHTERAIEEAIGLANVHDATLYVLYVINSAALAPGIDFEDLESIGERAVSHVADRASAAGVATETSVTHGLRTRAILTYATDHDVDLIVMGRNRGLERFLRGRVSERVSDAASVPVLVVE